MLGRQPDDFTNGFAYPFINGPHPFVHHASHRRRGMREFVQHQADVPVGPLFPAQAHEPRPDYAANCVFRRKIGIQGGFHRRRLRRANRMPKHFGVQAHLVTERVIHRSDIRARATAYFSNRRGVISAFGKHVTGRLDQLVPS